MGSRERLYTESYRCIADSLTYPPHCPPHWSSHWLALESCTHWASVTTESPSSWTCSPPTAMGGRGGREQGDVQYKHYHDIARVDRGSHCPTTAAGHDTVPLQRQGMTLSHYSGRA